MNKPLVLKVIHRKKGFSLIEIIIIVSIILILSVILFPTFLKSRDKGRSITCQNNLRQLGLATSVYVQDYDGHFPRDISRHSWIDSLEPYVKNKNVLYCPSLSSHGLDSTYVYNSDRATTYNHNVYNPINQTGVNEASIQNSSELVLLEDSHDSRYFPAQLVPISILCPLTRHGYHVTGIYVSTIHSAGSNCLFFDGHVKWLSPEQRTQLECQAGPYASPVS